MRDQLEQYLTEKGELPPGASLDLPKTYAKMTGEGELWVSADGLPLRQILRLQFPPGQDDQESRAEATVDFSGVGPIEGLGISDQESGSTALSRITFHIPRFTFPALSLAFCLLIVVHRRSRRLYIALVVTVIVSMIFSPLLQSLRVAAFFEQQQVRAQEQEALQQESKMQRDLQAFLTESNWNPNLNPLDTSRDTESPISNTHLPTLAANGNNNNDESTVPECDPDAADANGDDDEDGLTNFKECILGTADDSEDSDSDGIEDLDEVNGFSYNSSMRTIGATIGLRGRALRPTGARSLRTS